MRRATGFAVALLTCSALAWMAARAPSFAQTPPGYAGADACKDCHQTEWEAFQKSAHGRAAMDPSVVADVVGCESCHGPGSAHIAAGGDKDDPGFKTIRNLKKMDAASANDACLSCHKGGEQFYWQHSAHARNGVACIQCHSIHHPQNEGAGPMLTANDVNHLCITCHLDKRAAMARSAHMPLREGSITCADCHNPHGAPSARMIRAATVNELCYKCHADKRGPVLWEHAPVRENCLNCHQPHGSNNDKVLAGKRPYLCQRCHVASRHPSTLYDKPDLVTNRLFNRSCTNCHSQIHGSNDPSGKYFLR